MICQIRAFHMPQRTKDSTTLEEERRSSDFLGVLRGGRAVQLPTCNWGRDVLTSKYEAGDGLVKPLRCPSPGVSFDEPMEYPREPTDGRRSHAHRLSGIRNPVVRRPST